MLVQLKELGLIVKEKNEWVRIAKRINTTDDIPDAVIQKSHLSDLELIKNKIRLPIELRDFTSYTFPADPKLLSKAKDIIREAQEQLASLMMDGSTSQVYRISTYLYPLTEVCSKEDVT